jgi:hypothetical protein
VEGPPSEGGGIFRTKKGRKKDGLGVFSKLLAGLIKKKELAAAAAGTKKGEESPRAFGFDQKKPAVHTLLGGRLQKNGEEPSLALSRRQKEEKPSAQVQKQGSGSENSPGSKDTFDSLNFQDAKTLFESLDFSNGDPGKGINPLEEGHEETESTLQKHPDIQKSAREDRRLAGKNPGVETNSPAETADPQGIALQFRREDKKPPEPPLMGDKIRNKRRERIVEVQDLRGGTGPEAAASLGLKAVEKARHSDGEMVFELRPLSAKTGGSQAFENPPAQAGGAESFANLLARELSGELSSDIVKQAAIVLRDGEGTIRLTLKPESLGNVKIRLEMADNKIAGHIIVESDEALRAFEREIHTLEQAFEDSGFEQAKLELALDSRSQDRQWKGDEARPLFSERFAASHYDEAGLGAEASGGYAEAFGISAVNMLA